MIMAGWEVASSHDIPMSLPAEVLPAIFRAMVASRPKGGAWEDGRDLANQAVAALQKSGEFSGALLLNEGWELYSPLFLEDIEQSLEEGHRAKDALHKIIQNARKGLEI